MKLTANCETAGNKPDLHPDSVRKEKSSVSDLHDHGDRAAMEHHLNELGTLMPLVIRPETPNDQDAIRHVNRLAFGQDEEAVLVDALRAGGFVRLSLVAENEGQVVGHILFSELPIITERGVVPSLALAPLAVLPDFQRLGIGSELVRRGLDFCRRHGHRIVIVLGHPEYYHRFGFSAESARSLLSPFAGEAWMAMELVPGSLNGVSGRVEYPPPFGIP